MFSREIVPVTRTMILFFLFGGSQKYFFHESLYLLFQIHCPHCFVKSSEIEQGQKSCHSTVTWVLVTLNPSIERLLVSVYTP